MGNYTTTREVNCGYLTLMEMEMRWRSEAATHDKSDLEAFGVYQCLL